MKSHIAPQSATPTHTTQRIAALLRAMLRDGRPTLEHCRDFGEVADKSPKSADEQIVWQFEDRFYIDHTITSRPGSYYQMPHDAKLNFPINAASSKPHDVRNRYHPLPHRLSERLQELWPYLSPDIYICGGDTKRRFELAHIDKTAPEAAHKNQPVFPAASAYLVPAFGDVVVASEMMNMLEKRLSGADKHPERPIIIDNHADYWKYLLKHLEGITLSGLNIHIVTKDMPKLQSLLQQCAAKDAPEATKPVTIPPGALILVGTKTNEKIIELQELFKGTGVRVMRLDHLANFQDPKEISGTFAGNAMEKIRNAHKALRERAQQAPDLLRANLLKNCPNKNDPHIFILSEDSGLHLEDKRISRHMQAERLLQGKVKDELVLHHDQFPGVEFGPAVNGALGEQGFWDAVNDIIRRHENDPDEASRTRNRGVVNSSVLALSPFDINAPDTIQPVYMFSGSNMSWLQDKPIHERGEIPNTSHYLVPVSQDLQSKGLSFARGQLTQAQLGPDFLAHHSARTFAAKALRAQMGLPEGMDLPMPAHPLRLGVSHPASALAPKSDVIAANDALSRIDFANKDWSQQAEMLCAQPDVYYLSARDTHGGEQALFEDLFRFSSLIVTKQLVPRDKDKLMCVQRSDTSWKPFLDLYDHLRHIGMANDQQNTFIRRFDDEADLKALLEQAARNKFDGEHFTPQTFEDKNLEALTQQPPKHFNVAMFCSASSKNQTFNDEARSLGAFLARRGSGMVFGAADKEMMGSARMGFINAKAKQGKKGLLIGSSTQDILPIESEKPEDVIGSLDVYHHAPHIYARMAFMMHHSDAFAIYPGGVGTVQELMLLLAAKRAHHPDMKDKPIILYNRPLKDMGPDIGFYDPLIEMIGKERLEALGVILCDSPQKVFNAIDFVRPPRTKPISQGKLLGTTALRDGGLEK